MVCSASKANPRSARFLFISPSRRPRPRLNSRADKRPLDSSVHSLGNWLEMDQGVLKGIPDALVEKGEFGALEVVGVASGDFKLTFETDELDDLWDERER
jgi:hypothetical protein